MLRWAVAYVLYALSQKVYVCHQPSPYFELERDKDILAVGSEIKAGKMLWGKLRVWTSQSHVPGTRELKLWVSQERSCQ